MINTKSLFDTDEIWRDDPLEAFKAFVLSPEFVKLGRRKAEYKNGSEHPVPVRSSSAEVYIVMFAKFARWMANQQITLFSLTSDDIRKFLDAGTVTRDGFKKELNSAISLRYVRMLERVFLHLKVMPNPAQAAMFDAFKAGQAIGKDANKVVMTQAQQQAFMAALPNATKEGEQGDLHRGWKRRRDRAMQAMMLGAGLKVSEVIGIYTSNLGKIEETGSMPIFIAPASTAGASRSHQTQLRPFAVAEVQAWLKERRSMRIPGRLLFPATLQGGTLDKATVYRQVKATFARAGIDLQRQGGRTLRNSFAVRELKTETVEHVGELMGHRIRKSTLHYCIDGNT